MRVRDSGSRKTGRARTWGRQVIHTLVEEAETREVRAVKVLEEQRLPIQRKDGDVFTAM